eukprot:6175271-Pleurochrysis_carterae.AAC.2
MRTCVLLWKTSAILKVNLCCRHSLYTRRPIKHGKKLSRLVNGGNAVPVIHLAALADENRPHEHDEPSDQNLGENTRCSSTVYPSRGQSSSLPSDS